MRLSIFGVSAEIKASDLTPSIPIISTLELGLWAVASTFEMTAKIAMMNNLIMCKKLVFQNTSNSLLKGA